MQVDLHSGQIVSQQVDIWALGVLLYKLAFGRTPFEDTRGDVQNLGILSGFAASGVPSSSPYSSGLGLLLEACMTPNPNERPTVRVCPT